MKHADVVAIRTWTPVSILIDGYKFYDPNDSEKDHCWEAIHLSEQRRYILICEESPEINLNKVLPKLRIVHTLMSRWGDFPHCNVFVSADDFQICRDSEYTDGERLRFGSTFFSQYIEVSYDGVVVDTGE